MSIRLKNCQSMTFGLIIDRTKLIKLLMPCDDTPSKVLKKKKLSIWEYQDFASIVIFANTNFGVEGFEVKDRHLITSTPSFYLCNSRLIAAVLVLEYYPRQTCPQKPLYYKHWRYKNKTS